MKTSLLDVFQESNEHELLKVLIEEYKNSLDLTEDELVDCLVSKMRDVFEERYNAASPA
ncbi:hypothetical protein ACFLV7_08555 [Chloroflexota bacterium]